METAAADEIIAYWFGLAPEQWWRGKELDDPIRERFLPLWETERRRPAEAFVGSTREALAAVILFDQFPRNMFRDTAQSFASDPLALAIAKSAVDRTLDEGLSADGRLFLYMPFEHSERLEDQDRAVTLVATIGQPHSLDAAQKHRAVIARFGRFPHRNAILGRASTPEEIAAGNPEPWE